MPSAESSTHLPGRWLRAWMIICIAIHTALASVARKYSSAFGVNKMYGLPAGIDLSFFHQRTLLQLCIGVHEVILNFDSEIRITVTSSIGFKGSSNSTLKYADFRQAAAVLVSLLHQKIIFAGAEGAGTLMLVFASNEIISIYDDSDKFESYTIINADKLIVV